MVRNHKQLEGLKQKVSETFRSGNSLAIIGWKDSNHNLLTRSLPCKFVVFLDDSPGCLAQNIGFVLFTRFVSHALSKKIKKEKGKNCCHLIPLDMGQIRLILESCKDDIPNADPCSSSVQPVVEVKESNEVPINDPALDIPSNLLDFLTQPTPEIPQMTDMRKFAQALQDSVNQNADKQVSSKKLRELCKSFNITRTNQQLVVAGYVKRVESTDGRKSFWYLPGRLMTTETVHEIPVLPEDPYERLKFVVSEKQVLLAEKESLAKRQEEIDERLEVIADAERVINSVNQLLSLAKPN